MIIEIIKTYPKIAPSITRINRCMLEVGKTFVERVLLR